MDKEQILEIIKRHCTGMHNGKGTIITWMLSDRSDRGDRFDALAQEIINISKERLDHLEERDEFLSALEQSGVDNWSGYEYAHDIVDQGKDDQ